MRNMAKPITTAQKGFLRSRNVNSGRQFVGLVYESIDPEIRKKTSKAVSSYGKKMLQENGKIDRDYLIERAFLDVSGKTIEELRKMSDEELDLNTTYNDIFESARQAIEPSAMFYKPESGLSPTLSDFFKHGKGDNTNRAKAEKRTLFELPMDATEDEKIEYAIKDIKEVLPEVEPHKGLLRTTYKLVDFEYERDMGNVVDMYGKDIVQKAFRQMKKGSTGLEEKRIQLTEKVVNKKEGIHSKRNKLIGVAFAGISLGALAATTYALTSMNKNDAPDADHDGLLDGENVTLSKDDSKSASYINAGIVHRTNSNGSYTFFGEKTLGSDPHVASPDARDNAMFLSTISQPEYDKIKADGNLANFNIDGDSWSNRFEQLTGSPYDVKNDIYAVVMTMAGHEYGPVDEMFKILENAGIPKENVYDMTKEKDNSMNFEVAVKNVAQRSDKNDSVLFIINGHGSPGEFGFRDETGMSSVRYTWFKGLIDNIPSKNKVIVVDACYSGSAIKDLEGANKLILTCCAGNQEGAFGTTYDFLKAFSNISADEDKSGDVSIGEAAEYAKIIGTFESQTSPQTPQLSDVSNIGPTSYLIESKVEG